MFLLKFFPIWIFIRFNIVKGMSIGGNISGPALVVRTFDELYARKAEVNATTHSHSHLFFFNIPGSKF